MTTLQFVSEQNVLIGCSDSYDEAEFNTSSKKIGTYPYKIFTDGTDYYLFLGFENGDGNNSYIFKKKALPDLERVNKLKLLSGNWVAIDFCGCELNPDITYDPTSPVWPLWAWDLFLTKANVTGKEITIYYSDGSQDKVDITANKIGDSKYFAFSVGDDMYMYIQWINGDGGDQFYVLKKENI